MAGFKSRVLEVQSHTHDLYGNPIFTKDIIEGFIKSKGTAILRWAWVLHDKDKYTLEEERKSAEMNNAIPTVHAGDDKPKHIHLDLEFTNQVYNTAIAKDLGLPASLVQKPKCKEKRKQFMAMVTYLTHEKEDQQAMGKHRYDDSEIHANFDFRSEINKYLESSERSKAKHMKKSEVDDLVETIVNGGITIEQIKKQYGFSFFLDYEQRFLKARREYLKKHYQMLPRINYYIDGPSGMGKSTLAEMLARAIMPDLSADEAYYEVGAYKVRFDDYEQQPVIIWDDVRAGDLISEFGREGVLNLMELHPKKRNYNIKYGGVILTNQVNIFTGKESYEDFLDGLAGEYTDGNGVAHTSELWAKEQTYRRVPMIIRLNPSDIQVLLNRGVFNGTDEYREYEQWAKMKANILSINRHYTLSAKDVLGKRITDPIVQKHDEYMVMNSDRDKVEDADEIPEIEIAVGFEACKEMEKREHEEYAEFVKLWTQKHQALLKKESEKTYPYQRSMVEIVKEKVMTFDEWFAAGRPAVPGEGYVDSYADIANKALERKYEKQIDEAIQAGIEEYEFKREQLETEERKLEEEQQKEIDKLIDRKLRIRQLGTLADKFDSEKNDAEKTLKNYVMCTHTLAKDWEDYRDEDVVKSIISTAVECGFVQDGNAFGCQVTQARLDIFGNFDKPDLDNVNVRMKAEREEKYCGMDIELYHDGEHIEL